MALGLPTKHNTTLKKPLGTRTLLYPMRFPAFFGTIGPHTM